MSLKSYRTFAWFVPLFAALLVGACGAKEAAAPSTDAKPNSASQPSTYPQKDKAGANASNSAPGREGRGPNGNGNGQGGRPAPVLVVTAPVRESQFASEVEALGTAKANESIDVTAKVSNRITAIRFREGQLVRAGDVLVELDADEAKADLAVAEAALSDSRGQFNRARELAVTKALSAQQLEQLESTMRANEARVAASRARLNELTMRAPFGGRVGLRNVSVGGLVNTGTVITTLDDLSVMKVDFSVPETFLSMLREGLDIQATTSAYSGEQFLGKVLSLGSRVDPVSRSVLVRGQLANREGKLKPGMFMTVQLRSANSKALVIPEQALVPERDKQFVFAVRDNKAIKTEVVVGRRRPGDVEVVKGLQLGDLVVIEGTQKVRDGGPVRLASDSE
jgi:membrane fusion protein (multidrug efflux system)